MKKILVLMLALISVIAITSCGNDCKEHKLVTVNGYAATCEKDGLSNGKKCTVCGEMVEAQEVIPAGHIEVDVYGVPATCLTSGKTDSKKCAICGVETVPAKLISALGHTEVVVPRVEPTCSENGYTEGKKCSVCDTVIVEQKTIEQTMHTAETVKGKPATCKEEGLTDGKSCSVCKAVIEAQTKIPVAHHTGVVIPEVKNSCTAEGKTAGKKCSVCETIIVAQQVIPAAGHTEEIVPGTPATDTATGKTDGKKCAVCGIELLKQEVIPVIYPFSAFVDALEATKPSVINLNTTFKTNLGNLDSASVTKFNNDGSFTLEYWYEKFNDAGENDSSEIKSKIEVSVSCDAEGKYSDGKNHSSVTTTTGHKLLLDVSKMTYTISKDGDVLTANIAAANTEAVFGINFGADVVLVLTKAEGKISSFVLTYNSAAGEVTIVCDYVI